MAKNWSGFIDSAARKGTLRLFIPWAAPPSGRTDVTSAEISTVEWLLGEKGLAVRLGEIVCTESIVMLADSYARRNNYDMQKAKEYWQDVKRLTADEARVTFIRSSDIEKSPGFVYYLAEEAYALEKVVYGNRVKIIDAATKYTGLTGDEAYQSAAEYAMQRAAEARFVVQDLQALWISLNWPERDAMCDDSPRVYVPEKVRTPWLRSEK